MASKNIKGISIEIGGSTTGLQKALKSVDSTSVKLNSELKEVNKLLKFDPSNATLLAQKQQLLTDSIENTSTKLNQLKSAQSQVEAQFKSGNIGEEQYRAFQRELTQTEQSLNSYKSQLGGLQAEQDKLGQNTKRLDTFFKATGTSLDDYTDILGTRLVSAIKNGTASSDQLEMAINKIGKEALGAETDLSQMKQSLDKVDDGGSIDNVKTDLEELKVTSNSTDEELGKLGTGITQGNLLNATDKIAEAGEKIKEFAGATQDAFREVDDGLDTFTNATGQNSDAIKASFDKIYSSMPIESTADLGQALGSLTQQFGFTGDKLTSYGTQLMQFAQINNTDVKGSVDSAKSAIEAYGLSNDDLSGILDSVTATSQRTGVSVDSLFESAVKGAPQIKALNLTFDQGVEMLGQMEKAGVDNEAAIAAMSKASVNYAKDGKSLSDGLKDTSEKIKNASSDQEALTIATEAFGSRAAPKMVDAIKRGTLNLDELAKSAQNNNGTVSETFDKTVDDIDKQTVASQQAKLAMAEFGAAIATGIKPILDMLIPIIKSLGEAFANMPTGVKTVIVIIGGLAVAFTALAPFISSLMIVIPALGGAFTALGGFITATAIPAIGGLITAIIPFLPIIAAVALAIGAIILVVKNWGAITDWVSEKWNSFKDFIGNLWNGIKDTASNIWNGITSNISNAVNSVMNAISGVWNSIKSTTSNIWNGIKSTISGVWDGIKSTTSNVVNGVKNTVSNVFNGLKSTVTGIWNGIKSAITNPVEAAKNTVSNIINTIKGLFNFKLKFPDISIPHIPLPHFGLSGSFNPLKGQIPKISVNFGALNW
ncbi:MAG: phage tail tape measure protein [Streptococcaceae bacterium]|jgi:phage-related minor tail protein|nr:phage tail tape measure protein [Streptococcaceae bacterium]MCH4178102.1 phage tail tape measure protein [Streptococcaceae bacterium]